MQAMCVVTLSRTTVLAHKWKRFSVSGKNRFFHPHAFLREIEQLGILTTTDFEGRSTIHSLLPEPIPIQCHEFSRVGHVWLNKRYRHGTSQSICDI